MPDLMPFGLLHKFDLYKDFERAYFARLDQKGVQPPCTCHSEAPGCCTCW